MEEINKEIDDNVNNLSVFYLYISFAFLSNTYTYSGVVKITVIIFNPFLMEEINKEIDDNVNNLSVF